jgi:hypothetical protein
VELLRHQFRHGEPALPLRHSARNALQLTAGEDSDAEWTDDVLIVISELVQDVNKHTRSAGELIVSIRPRSRAGRGGRRQHHRLAPAKARTFAARRPGTAANRRHLPAIGCPHLP